MADITSNVPKPTFGPTGFQIPSDSEILAGTLADVQQAFGGNLNPALNTPQGQLASSMAAIISNIYQTFLFYTTQTDPAYALGRMQDAIARIYFLERNPAESTVVVCTCIGFSGTVIPTGTLAQDNEGNLYACVTGGTIPVGGSITLNFANTVPGPTPCPSGTLTIIYQAVVGWDTITNPADGALGSNTETRSDFEVRRAASVAGNSRGTIQAIQGAVLSVSGVLDAFCYQNDSGSPITYLGVTIPAHAIYVAAVGGADQDVGNAIWSKKSPGCSYYSGNTSVVVLDQSAPYTAPYPSYTVTFERPGDATIGFVVNIQSNALVPSDAATQIQNAIINAFAGADGGQRANIGSTIFASRFYAPVALLGPWAELISTQIVDGWVTAATFTASISGTTMTVTAVASGALAVGQTVSGINMQNANILAQLTGSAGSTGTYQLDVSQTALSGAASAYLINNNSVSLDINEEPVTAAPNILVVLHS